MSGPESSPPANREFVFRTIQLLMFADIVVGIALVLLGLFVYDLSALAIAGGFLACMGLGLAVMFRRLARREASATRGSPHQLRR